MKNKTIMKNNKLIAKFMGFKKEYYDHGINGISEIWSNDKIYKGHYLDINEMRYHESWDWLMPVVEKIENINNGIASFAFHIESAFNMAEELSDGAYNWVFIYKIDLNHKEKIIINESKKSKINAVYDAVIKFIKWYNKQKRK